MDFILFACSDNHEDELEALHHIMQDNTTLKRIEIDRLGLYTSRPHTFWDKHWLEKGSLSAQGRMHRRSTYFFGIFNKLGREKFVRNVPLNSPNDYDNQLMETIGSVRYCDTDSEIQLSAVYELLKANIRTVLGSSLPPHGTVARRSMHRERGCQTYVSIRSGKRRRRDKCALRSGKLRRRRYEDDVSTHA